MILKKLKLSMLTMGIAFTMFASVAYAAYSTYRVTLPSLKGDVTLMQGTKTTDDHFINHKDILIGPEVDDQSMAVWVDKYENGSWERVGGYDIHYEGQGPYTLHTNPISNGDLIRVRADNADLSPYNYGVIGQIDLR